MLLLAVSVAFCQEPAPGDVATDEQIDLEGLGEFAGHAIAGAIGGYFAGDFDYSLTPTGDPLFDRYAEAVEAVYAAAGPDDSSNLDKLAALPDSILAEWEAEFGSSPEYWELRYFCASKVADPGAAGADSLNLPVEFLRKARDTGVASSNTLLLLFLEEQARVEAELDGLTPYEGFRMPWAAQPDGYSLPPRVAMSSTEREAFVAAQMEADELLRTLLDEAVKVDPDNPWAYYLRALYLMEYGEVKAAIDDVAIGNRVPISAYPTPYPYQLVVDHLLDGEPAGSKTVSGSVLGMEDMGWAPQYIRIKEHTKDIAAIYSLTGDLALADEWLTFQCRLPFAQQANHMPGLVAMVTYRLLLDQIEETYGHGMSGANLETVRRMRSAWVYLRYDLTSSKEYVWVMDEMLAMIPFHGMRAYPLAYYKYAEGEAKYTGEMLAVFTDFEQVSLAASTVPSGLEKYKPMNLDEFEFDRILRRKARDIAYEVGRNAMTPEQRKAEDDMLEAARNLAETIPPPNSN